LQTFPWVKNLKKNKTNVKEKDGYFSK